MIIKFHSYGLRLTPTIGKTQSCISAQNWKHKQMKYR